MGKFDLVLAHPLMNASGTLGFAPEGHGPVDLAGFGAFVTPPISQVARTPARGRRYLPFPGGFLLHTGYPNPGLDAVLRRYAPAWGRATLPVIVHLIPHGSEVSDMVRRLENVEGVMAVEIGLPADIDPPSLKRLVDAALSELPLIVRLPLERAAELAPALTGSGITAISLGAPRGALPGPEGAVVHGRLFGPGIFPLALEVVGRVAGLGVALIGAGGVYGLEQAQAMLAAGALAVQVDAALWRGTPFNVSKS